MGTDQLKARQAENCPSRFFMLIDKVGGRLSQLLWKQAPTLSYSKTSEAGKASVREGFVSFVIELGSVALRPIILG